VATIPSIDTDRSMQARCAECYEALFAGCRSHEVGALPIERQLWELTRLVSAYACSARDAQVGPRIVLADLRSALEPVLRAQRVPIDMLMQRASADYYGAYPH
jgi:hypothetical protein